MNVRHLFLALLAIVSSLAAHQADAAAHRVALGSFTTDEYTWESLQAADASALAIQAALGQVPDVEWVAWPDVPASWEEKALGTFAASLKAARLAKADWMITGRFVSQELVLEAIDLAHADVLAEQRVAIPGAALKNLPAMVAGVRALLEAAAQRENEVAGLPSIAILHYPDVAGFQREFEAALADPQLTATRYRLLRAPHASLSPEEADLLLATFADGGKGAWHSIADAWLWGELRKSPEDPADPEEVRDPSTPEVALNVWDGKRAPVRFVEESERVDRAELPQESREQAGRLAGSVAEFLRQPRAGAPDDAQRVRIAQSLLAAADELEGSDAGSLRTVAERRYFLNMVQVLEAACFFDPQSALALERLTRARWNNWLTSWAKTPGRFKLARCHAWGRYVDRFGRQGEPSAFDQIEALSSKDVVDAEQITKLMQSAESGNAVSYEFLRAAQTIFAIPDDPAGLPAEELLRTEDRRAREVARRALLVRGEKEAHPVGGLNITFRQRPDGAFAIRDPQYRIEVLEKMWPSLSPAQRQSVSPTLRESIKLSYTQAGRPDGEAPLLAAVPLPPPPRPPGTREPFPRHSGMGGGDMLRGDLFDYQPVAVPTPGLKTQVTDLDVLAKLKIQRVYEMVLLAGTMWLVAEEPLDTQIVASNVHLLEAFRPVAEPMKRLYSYHLATGVAQRGEALGKLAPFSLFAYEGRLWISLQKNGVAELDPQTGTLRRFGKAEGVTEGYRFAAAGGKLFVTGANMEQHEFDAAAGRWKAHRLGAKERAGYASQSRSVAGRGPWLLVAQGPLLLEDLRTSAWKPLEDLKANGASLWVRGGVGAVMADATGFWIRADTALCRLDPAAGRLTAELPLESALTFRRGHTVSGVVAALAEHRAAVRPEVTALPPWHGAGFLGGSVDSVLPDGDFLWVTARLAMGHAQSRLMLWHQPSRRWVGEYRAGLSPCLAVDDKYLWLASADSAEATLRRIEKRPLYATSPKRMVATPDEKEARAAYEKLSIRDQAWVSFTRGRYAEAAALFAQVPLGKHLPPWLDPEPEVLFLQALCYDAQGLAQPDKQRAFLQDLQKRFPGHQLAEQARRQLAAPPPP